ncbi:MAG: hypothetical protein RLZZ156_2470, partial [Deinococcota bacterium]
MTLPIRRVTLYKHGLGFFERAGRADSSFALEFPRRAMDDALKSLAVLTLDEGAQVLGVAFETPPDRNQAAQRQPLQFDPPISGLLQAFAGSRVMVFIGERSITGEIIGLEIEEEKHLERALLAVSSEGGIELIPLAHISKVALLDERAQADLEFALLAQRKDTERAFARVTLSKPSEVEISYIAPAPAWRVSYRLLARAVENDPEARDIFVQGWGLFDNTLEEDLENVTLTLTAGMPVSFRYELHTPNTPERPLVRDENRTVNAPIEFDALMDMEQERERGIAPMAMAAPPAPGGRLRKMSSQKLEASYAGSAPAQATGEAKGALFAYNIATPVSVKRGESGMVSILGFKVRGSRELLYNPQKTGVHPVASLRFKNQSLTLERGPCTILDNADYAGEAVVPFSPSNTDVILAFAMELGITMQTSSVNRETTTRIYFHDGGMYLEGLEYLETTYEASSQLSTDTIITLEHPRWYNSSLEQKPLEETLELARYKFSATAQKRTSFTILEQRLATRYQDIRGTNSAMLSAFLAQRLLNATTLKSLEAILGYQAKTVDLANEISKNETERSKVRSRMDDTRKNLEPLTSPQDAKLRTRLVQQLERLEDSMQSLENRDKAIVSEQQ